jgi:hypothetical protein
MHRTSKQSTQFGNSRLSGDRLSDRFALPYLCRRLKNPIDAGHADPDLLRDLVLAQPLTCQRDHLG